MVPKIQHSFRGQVLPRLNGLTVIPKFDFYNITLPEELCNTILAILFKKVK